jgi:hypothetical protein
VPLTPEERRSAQEIFDTGAACPECGGLHMRACPRVKSYRIKYKPENTELVLEREVEYFPPGTWEDTIVFRDDVYEED